MRIIFYECKMDLLRTLRYKMGIISDIVVFTILLCFFLLSDTGSSFQDKYNTNNYKTLLLLGYIAWTLSSSAISNITGQISSEIQRGTFYIKLNCKLPLQIIYLGNLISAIFVQAIVIIIYTIITHFIFGVDYFFNIEILASLIICAIGMYGIGLFVAGFSLFFKRVGSLIFLLQISLLFVTDTVPTSNAITYISGFIPLTKCNEVIRSSFSGNTVSGSFIQLIIYSLICFIIGYIVFGIFMKLAKKKGNLLLY